MIKAQDHFLQRSDPARTIAMLDIILVGLGIGFFAVTIAYAYACEWL